MVFAKPANALSGIETNSFWLYFFCCRLRFYHYSKKDIVCYQKKKLNQIINYALNHSNFYKNLYRDYNTADFYSLPVINKKIMMENLTGFNTVGLTKKEIIDFCLENEKTRNFNRRLYGLNVAMSSGTSGNKGVEIDTPQEENYTKAALFARFDFIKKEKINLAFILRVTTPAVNFNKFGHALTYISQLDTLENITNKLNALNPNIVSAPPSMLKILAKQQKNGLLKIKPKRLVSYAEVLYPDVKKFIKEIFCCPVHEIYKCTEGPIGLTCRYGKLHINEDMVLAELYNKDGSVTQPGNPCHQMIITDLNKKSQPIIRYALNDIITIDPKPCRCGSCFRVIKEIQGRCDDMFWARSKLTGKWQFIFPDYISRAVISASDDIDEFQVIQQNPEKILVRIIIKPNSAAKTIINNIKVNITKLFSDYQCQLPKVNVVLEKPVYNINSYKLIRIHREFEIEDQ